MLSPGPHPRGKRSYIFAGEWFGDPIPGAFSKNGRTMCAVDAAWIFAQQGMQVIKAPGLGRKFQAASEVLEGLFPYQVDGMEFLAHKDYAFLADEMGLGKTVQALFAAEMRLLCGAGPVSGPAVLVLCPAIAKRHWSREIKRWTGHDAQILEGVRTLNVVPSARYVVANYDILYGTRRRSAAGKLEEREGLTGWKSTLAALKFPIVIADEVHTLRGEKSLRRNAVAEVAKDSTCFWGLSGTLMPNRVRDIWGVLDLASKGLFGWFWVFAKAYCGYEKTIYGSQANGRSREEELGARLSFFVLGRTKASVGLQLPEKRREVVEVDVKVEHDRHAYTKDSKPLVVEFALRATAKAKQPAVIEMVKEAILAKQKVVVFTYLRAQAEDIGRAVVWENGSVFVVNGDQTPEQRDISAQAFRESAAPAVFVATIDSVGVAISLVGADLIIFADLSYDPSKLLQAEARAHRIGSERPVLIRYVIAAGTLEEDIAEMIVNKLENIQAAMGAFVEGVELSSQLGRGKKETTEAIVDRLFARLMEG